MLPGGNTAPSRRCLGATWLLALLGVLVLPGNAAHAQPAAPAPTPATVEPTVELRAPLVDWSHVQQMHRLTELWVSRGEVPAQVDPLRVTGVPAVRVTLRWLGMTVGVGDALTREQSGDASDVDLANLTRQAAVRALGEVSARLQRQAAQAPAPAAPNAPARNTNPLRDVAPQLLVDVQVAYDVQRIPLDPGTPADVVFTRFVPGYHGLRLHRPGQTSDLAAAWIWPSSAIAANINPRSQLLQLLADLKIRHEQLDQVGRPNGPMLERFQVIHMVRPLRDVPVQRLERGHAVLPAGSLDSRTLEAMNLRLVQHLLRWHNPADGTLAGTYHPTPDRHEPTLASAEDQALAAYALARWIEVWQKSAEPDDLSNQAQQVAARLVSNVTSTLDQGPQVEGPAPAVAALTLLTIHHNPTLAVNQRTQRDALAQRLAKCVDEEGGIRQHDGDQAARLSLPGQAVVLAALAVHVERTRDPELAGVVARAHSFLWRHRAASEIAVLPWLVMVEAREPALALPKAQDVPDTAARRDALRQAADALLDRQIVRNPEHGPADVVGGFDLRLSNPPPMAPDPDWQSAYPLILLAIATRHQLIQQPDSQAGDTLEFLLRGGLAARFLAQLMVAEPGCYYIRNVDTALGGVRLNLWDNRLAVAPHAMTLLATSELLHALLEARP